MVLFSFSILLFSYSNGVEIKPTEGDFLPNPTRVKLQPMCRNNLVKKIIID